MRTLTFKSSFQSKVNILWMLGHTLLILGMTFIMHFPFSLYFLMEFPQYLKIPFLWSLFKLNKQMCARTHSYSKRCVPLMFWLTGNHKTEVWSSIISRTFLKDEDYPVHPGIPIPPFLYRCLWINRKPTEEMPSKLHGSERQSASKCKYIYILVLQLWGQSGSFQR